ncbi:MAG: DUF3486 family protein [Geobacteraceae bacterium]|nr:DUF3486 family protein [Geobacteraceae bacterium]
MGKRAEMENAAIRLYAEGMEIPAISDEIGVSENSLREWKKRAGNEWDEARAACRKGFVASMETVGARLLRARQISDQLTGDAKSQGRMGLSLNQAVQTMIYDVIGQMQTTGILDPETMTGTIDQLKGLSLTLARLEQAAGLNLKREAEIRKQALTEAADNVEKAAIQQGLNAEQAAFWRSQVLGVQ